MEFWYFARNFVIFGAANTGSLNADNKKNSLLVLGKGPTKGINNGIGAAENKCGMNFSKG